MCARPLDHRIFRIPLVLDGILNYYNRILREKQSLGLKWTRQTALQPWFL